MLSLMIISRDKMTRISTRPFFFLCDKYDLVFICKLEICYAVGINVGLGLATYPSTQNSDEREKFIMKKET